MRRSVAWLLCACVLSLAPLARADDTAARAEHLFLQGRKSYAAGKYEEAALLFERANELAPHPSVVFNAATAWDQAGNPAYAADSYAEALAGELDDASKLRAQKRLKELEPRLGIVEVRAPHGTELKINGHVKRSFPSRVHVLPGAQTLSFTLPDGTASQQRADVSAGAIASIDLTPKPAPVEVEARHEPAPPPPADHASVDARTWQIAGWAAVGVSAGLGVGSAILWNKAKSERDALIEGDASARGRAQTLQTWTNVTLVSSVALGAAGITVLVLRPGRTKETSSVSLSLGRTISVSGNF